MMNGKRVAHTHTLIEAVLSLLSTKSTVKSEKTNTSAICCCNIVARLYIYICSVRGESLFGQLGTHGQFKKSLIRTVTPTCKPSENMR